MSTYPLSMAFVLGLAGSLHCAGMCGPLAMALPRGRLGDRPGSIWGGRLAYNMGRVLTYTFLGFLFGLAGQSLALGGVQRWVSIGAGLAILVGWFLSSRTRLDRPAYALVHRLKSVFGSLWQNPSPVTALALGMLNGLLPCGLVYAACAGSLSMGSFTTGALFMVVFGLGTVPMMLGLGILGAKAQGPWRIRMSRLTPATLVLVSLLLILRGLALGIPYLSPELCADGRIACPSCSHSPSAIATTSP